MTLDQAREFDNTAPEEECVPSDDSPPLTASQERRMKAQEEKPKEVQNILDKTNDMPTDAPVVTIPNNAEIKTIPVPFKSTEEVAGARPPAIAEEEPIITETVDVAGKTIDLVGAKQAIKEGLKALCDEKGITYHHAAGVKKLKELLAAAE